MLWHHMELYKVPKALKVRSSYPSPGKLIYQSNNWSDVIPDSCKANLMAWDISQIGIKAYESVYKLPFIYSASLVTIIVNLHIIWLSSPIAATNPKRPKRSPFKCPFDTNRPTCCLSLRRPLTSAPWSYQCIKIVPFYEIHFSYRLDLRLFTLGGEDHGILKNLNF